jgi:hypothetical protein
MYLNQILTLSLQNNILLSNQILLLSQIASSNAKSRIFLQKKTNRNNSNDFLLNYNLVSNSNNPNIEIKRGDNTLENKFDIVTNRINEENSNISKMKISNISEKENAFLSGNFKNHNSSINENDNIFNNKEFNENLFIKQLENNKFLYNNDISKPNSSFICNNNKNNFFNIINIKGEEKQKNNYFNEKSDTSLLNLEENSNEIKVLKNHKAVYVNNYLLNTPTTSKKLKKLNKIAFIGRSKRGSRFRGVSKNGNQFQVLIMQNKGKSYIGSYNSEEYAARVYDILAIKYRGIKARTNFIYSSQQIKKIYEMDIDVKSKNIYDIIDELI